MLESLDFHYDGISSKDMGLMNVQVSGGMFEEIFLPNRSINKVKIRGNDKSYFQSIKREDISLPLTFMLPDGYTEEQEREIKRWFNQDYYKPFYFDDYPHRMFYVMYEGDSKVTHNGLGQGYFQITLESNSPYSYSPEYLSPLIEANNINGYGYEFVNSGDLSLLPEIWITSKANQDVKIHNLSNGIKFEFTGLTSTETIYVDNEKKDIITDLLNTYRFDNFNNKYLRLDRGVNRLLIYGNCDIQFRYQYTFLD